MSSEDEAVAWLRAQVEGDRALALAAGDDEQARTWAGSDNGYSAVGGVVRDGHGEYVVYDEGSPNTAQALHMGVHDPRDAIADCAAKLALLDFCCRVIADDEGHEYWSDGWAGLGVAKMAVGSVAASYRHREGYGKHWGKS